MSENWETFLRSIGVVVAFAVLSYLSNATNIAPLVGVGVSGLIAALAAVVDKSFSPDGTVVFGTVGKSRF